MVTDPISDFITRIKNASDAKKPAVSMPYSALKESIAHALHKAGYVKAVTQEGKKVVKTLEIELAYVGGVAQMNGSISMVEPVVKGVDRVSKPSRRIYQKAKDIRPFKNGFGNVVLSTPKGILLDVEAKKQKVGGEVLFKIW
jgi:small subunit ribosomal protein S8